MRILKFSGIVVGVHLLALFLIFANPGCSSSTKQPPSKADTVTAAEAPPEIKVAAASAGTEGAPPPISFNTDSVRYSPTRPGTAAASSLEVEPVNNVTPASTYAVVAGDNLTVIAKKNHLTISELAAANNLNPATAKLRPGQKLIIPAKMAAPAKTTDASARSAATAAPVDGSAAPKATADVFKHTVKAGESLSSIAQKYGVKVGEIGTANNISDPKKIRPGMELVIPGWQPTGGRARSSSTAAKPTETNARASTPPSSTPPVVETVPSYRPPAGNEVPVIQVEEAPAPTK